MGELNTHFRGAVLSAKSDDARQRLLASIVVEPETTRGDAPLGTHMGRFGDQQAATAQREGAQMHELPVICDAILRNVLTHRRHHHPVGEFKLTQADGREQLAHVRLSR